MFDISNCTIKDKIGLKIESSNSYVVAKGNVGKEILLQRKFGCKKILWQKEIK